MAVLIIIFALILEQFLSPFQRGKVFVLFIRYSNFLRRKLDAGEVHNGMIAWLTAIVPVIVLFLLLHLLLAKLAPVLAFLMNLGVLYLCMGFRQFSYSYTAINQGFQTQNLETSRQALAKWTQQPTSELSENEMLRLMIEQGVLDSYRHLFAVMFWFVVFYVLGLGAMGAVLYRLVVLLPQRWFRTEEVLCFGAWSKRMLDWMDYLPVRLTALSFAVVGSFVDTIDCWRKYAKLWHSSCEGVLFSATAGALNIRLGGALRQNFVMTSRPELGDGDEVENIHLQSVVGLIWRAVVIWVVMIALLTLAHLS